MFQRPDGIVDFDSGRCIGCKACMQACPYDAIYIDPENQTAAKCNYCAHRVEVGLEPACVIVCPEQAIVAGDLDHPESRIAQLLHQQTIAVRKPEAGTRPKLYYVEGEPAALIPTAARHEAFYLWSQRNEELHGGGADYSAESPFSRPDVLAAYDVDHERPWGWRVPAYLWTKSIGSAPLLLPTLAAAVGWIPANRIRDMILALVALAFTTITALLLITDLTRPERFLRILLTPQRRSWLARGGFILGGYSTLSGLFLLARLANWSAAAAILIWPTLALGLEAAVYTAFLFAQCKGRELWRTSLLAPHLIVQAGLAGAAVLASLPSGWGASDRTRAVAAWSLAVCLGLHALIVLEEIVLNRGSDNARYAARLITKGRYRNLFWVGSMLAGVVLPGLLLACDASNSIMLSLAGALALAGLLAFEWCFVMAAQKVPNS
jgi:formate-dependent nitrite reductase membrane component NrfD/ferredoxin